MTLNHFHYKNDKTHLIHRPIDICATSPLRLIKGTLSFLSLGMVVKWRLGTELSNLYKKLPNISLSMRFIIDSIVQKTPNIISIQRQNSFQLSFQLILLNLLSLLFLLPSADGNYFSKKTFP